MLLVLIIFSVAAVNILKSNLRVYSGSWFAGAQAIRAEGMAARREAAGHRASTVRKQREMEAGAQFAFSFSLSPGSRPRVWCCPLTGTVFPLQ